MAGIACPKCGQKNAADAVICGGCDYILDTSFLGDDILNQPTRDDTDLPPPTGEASDFGGDAVILGQLGRGAGAGDANEWESFLSDRTGSFLVADTSDGAREIEPAQVYLDRTTQALLEPNAVLRVKPAAALGSVTLSPFEQHVLGFVDGERPVARIRKKSGLSMSDTKIALAMIADRGLLELVGTVKPGASALKDHLGAQLAGELDDDTGEERTVEQNPHADDPAAPAPSSDGFGERTLPLPTEIPPPAPTVPMVPPPGSKAPTIPGVPSIPGIPSIPPLPPRTMRAPPPEVVASGPPTHTGTRPAAPAAPVIDAAREQALKLYELALADLRTGKKARAHMYAKMALQACPDEAKVKDLLANWQRAESLAKAESEDQRMVVEAQRAEDAGDFGRALHLLKQAVEKNPLAGELHNRVGVILATRLCDYTAASSALLRAVELDPKNMVYRSNLGKVFKMSEGKSVGALITDPNAVPQASADKRPTSMLDKLKNRVGR